jgi:YfiH family protein
MNAPDDWLVPDWPAPAHVQALFTTRMGGVSAAPFASFNLGDHVRDDPVAVAANRQRLADALLARPVFLQQVHGTAVASLDAQTPDGTVADACVSTQPGVACTVMVADCLPVLFTDTAGTVVAAAHAGWRGLAAGVLESCLERMARHRPSDAEVLAWLGPCIGPQAFEVGEEVRTAFVAWRSDAAGCFEALPSTGKYLANLPQLARLRLQALGVNRLYGNDGTPPWCTVTQSSRFFSHRRDAVRLGSTGRMAACIWIA